MYLILVRFNISVASDNKINGSNLEYIIKFKGQFVQVWPIIHKAHFVLQYLHLIISIAENGHEW